MGIFFSLLFVAILVGFTWLLVRSGKIAIAVTIALGLSVIASLIWGCWWFLLWGVVLAGAIIARHYIPGNAGKWIMVGALVLIIVGGTFFTAPAVKTRLATVNTWLETNNVIKVLKTNEETAPAATEVTATEVAATEIAVDPAYVCVDPSSIPYGSYTLVAEEPIKGPAIVEWWDQTPAAYDKVTGKLDLSAMKGHEGIQFVASGETITPARGIVGSVFVLSSDGDLLCVKNQHLLAYFSKPAHIYAKSPEELVLPVPLAPAK